MKRRPYTIIVAKRVREKTEAFFETHEELIPCFLQLMQEIRLTPYEGAGRPHRLTRELRHINCWSRCLDREHRLVYNVIDSVRNVFIVYVGEHY